MMIALDSMGGTGARKRNFFNARVPSAPISVASVPKMMSGSGEPSVRLARRQKISYGSSAEIFR